MGTAILSIYLVIIGGCLLMVLRNLAVFYYRKKLIDRISAAAREDILCGRDWLWRYREFELVSYDDMMLQFWRPLGSFYPDRAFITSGTTMPSGW